MYAKDRITITDRREMLRVKLKSLAEEARIIRKEEGRTWGPLREQLHRHRIFDVRTEARATHLAYGLIKGRTMEQMEPTRKKPEPFTVPAEQEKALLGRVRQLVKKYGPATLDDAAINAATVWKKAA